MNPRIFRQASLARLASPEELDQIIKVTSSKNWAALIALLLVCGASLVWAFTGRIPTMVSGRGVIVRVGGVLTVVARGTGIVYGIDASVGDRVGVNQVVARIAQPGMNEKLRGMRFTLSELRAKRVRDLELRRGEVRLQIDAIERQRANTTREIGELQTQATLAVEQVSGTTRLEAQGLVTAQETNISRQRLVSIRSEIEDRRARLVQLDAQELSSRSLVDREDSEMRYRIASMEREIATYSTELQLVESVVSPYAGEVLELRVSQGAPVTEGVPILSIQPDVETLEAIVYVPSVQAKDVRPGLDVNLSPSTVRPEEYGFMTGKVTFVAGYPATPAAILRNFQNDALVIALTAAGPVTEMRVVLERDERTTSGFRWSSSAGPPITISSGSFCGADVVTDRRVPITLLWPAIKSGLGVS